MVRPKKDNNVLVKIKEWFALDKYSEANNFNAEQWFNQLMFRLKIKEDIVDLHNENRMSAEIPAFLTENIRLLKKNPIIPESEFSLTKKTINPASHQKPTAHALSRHEAYHFHAIMTKSEKEKKLFQLTSNTDSRVLRLPSELELINDNLVKDDLIEYLDVTFDKYINSIGIDIYNPYLFGAASHVVLDLAATDEQIVTDIRRLLPTLRDTVTEVTAGLHHQRINDAKFNETFFAKLIKIKFLPYTDIWLISNYDDIALNRANYTELLSGTSGCPDTDELRKTIEPLFATLMNRDILIKLYIYTQHS